MTAQGANPSLRVTFVENSVTFYLSTSIAYQRAVKEKLDARAQEIASSKGSGVAF